MKTTTKFNTLNTTLNKAGERNNNSIENIDLYMTSPNTRKAYIGRPRDGTKIFRCGTVRRKKNVKKKPNII